MTRAVYSHTTLNAIQYYIIILMFFRCKNYRILRCMDMFTVFYVVFHKYQVCDLFKFTFYFYMRYIPLYWGRGTINSVLLQTNLDKETEGLVLLKRNSLVVCTKGGCCTGTWGQWRARVREFFGGNVRKCMQSTPNLPCLCWNCQIWSALLVPFHVCEKVWNGKGEV